ncbi:methyltransferase family protein [Kordiimonas lacus]|uniref:Protein-S-isoprenylcysteine O-methyltransferase Ste14 n=1 Tax=Kordiimonas lacus TaxID=637679 RepID=A0A1G7F5F3_9PROT|nr:isoprenylcysteine carboxylmethyltransferase family protein [Kordiimonas lacus]SDE71148.1 Protein-S-isoprenylcysteine O-methyltransferase Ste14 [Kordiimonas lacus]
MGVFKHIGIVAWPTSEAIMFGFLVLSAGFELVFPISLDPRVESWLVIAGGVLFVEGVWLLLQAKKDLKAGLSCSEEGAGKKLVHSGVYALSRNPIYVSNFLMLASFALWGLYWLALLLPIIIFVYWKALVQPEERFLSQRYDVAYDLYVAHTPRWFQWKLLNPFGYRQVRT